MAVKSGIIDHMVAYEGMARLEAMCGLVPLRVFGQIPVFRGLMYISGFNCNAKQASMSRDQAPTPRPVPQEQRGPASLTKPCLAAFLNHMFTIGYSHPVDLA